ncbi:hypothetical protein HRbin40_01373 [bacterium HR40]|nr:hypothetical protein HRbin40_01373 [bacterium HR40]
MPTLDITINGRRHTVQCGEGEEGRLRRLASYVDGRVRELAQQYGQIGDTRLLVLAALLIADELDDAYAEIRRLRQAGNEQARESEAEVAALITRVAERLEQLAAALETA